MIDIGHRIENDHDNEIDDSQQMVAWMGDGGWGFR